MSKWKWIAAAAFVVVGSTAAVAIAQPRFGQQMMQHRLNAHIDDAMDAIAANDHQRVAVRGAIDSVVAQITEHHGERIAAMADGAVLFTSEKLDAAKLAELRATQEGEAVKITDSVIQAAYDIHAALTPAQRKSLVEYVRNEMPSGKGGWRGKLMTNMVDSKLENFFDEIKASPDQRTKLTAVKDDVVGSWLGGKSDRRAMLDKALQLFTADTIDKQAVASLRSAHLAQIKAVADRVEAGVRTVHATLTVDQRRAAIAAMRAHHQQHGGHMEQEHKG